MFYADLPRLRPPRDDSLNDTRILKKESREAGSLKRMWGKAPLNLTLEDLGQGPTRIP